MKGAYNIFQAYIHLPPMPQNRIGYDAPILRILGVAIMHRSISLLDILFGCVSIGLSPMVVIYSVFYGNVPDLGVVEWWSGYIY